MATVFFVVTPLAAGELDPFSHLPGHSRDEVADKLTFTQTQSWDSGCLAETRKTPRFLPANWKSLIAAGPPPRNSSIRVRAELDYLLTLQAKRTPEDIARIQGEIQLPGFSFDGMTYPQITDPAKHPQTARLAAAVNGDLAIVVMQIKQFYDRVRPSRLDPRIQPCIEIPGHPAYPSGHSTQAFAWAFVLGEIFPPGRQERLMAGAESIARNRELAGVHYPSDTAFGREIARRLVDLWMENPEFRNLVEKARGEWKE